ncbi:MAG: hypothetical protein JRH11_08240 [Deltaproteobacteria bacterium]|nr:hypothetical protein [Deltaproteobacteria bacterium]
MDLAATCLNHPRREAIGVCVKCRGQMCSECVTRVDGINYCVTCLARLADAEKPAGAGASVVVPRALAPAFAMAWLTLLTLLAWGLVEVVFPGG